MGSEELERNKRTIRRVLAAYAEGDLEPLLAAFDDDVEWHSNALTGHYRFGGPHKGKAGLCEGLSVLAADYTLHRYEVRELVGEGDVIWALCDVAATHSRSGRPVSIPLVSRWQFGGGKVIAFSEYFDTAAVLAQEGRLPAELPRSATG